MIAVEREYQVVVADDDPGYRETLGELLLPHFSVITVACGEEAIEVVEHYRVDLILCDMHMHVLTGLETLRIVKRLRIELPGILMSADLTDQIRRDALEVEKVFVLSKPVSRRDLLETVMAALRLAKDAG